MVQQYLTLDDIDVAGKTVLLRVDINSPIDPESGEILDYSRFRAHIDTFQALRDAKVIVMAHQSRPGKKDFTSLFYHSIVLGEVLKKRVKFVDGLFDSRVVEKIKNLNNGEILMLENTRFYSEEVVLANKGIDIQQRSNIVKKLAPLIDYVVNDAFAAIHRGQPSLVAFAELKPMVAGMLMHREISMLTKFIEERSHPKIAVLGGAKPSDSVRISKNMMDKKIVDTILTGGLVAHIFLLAKGVEIGKKNRQILAKEVEDYKQLVNEAKEIVEKYNITTPSDFAVNSGGSREELKLRDLPTDRPIMDIGIETIAEYIETLMKAKNIILNGPLGVYETPEYAVGTEEIFEAIAAHQAFKVAGGGHTISTISKLKLTEKFDHISVGGGALISFLAGEKLPVLEALKKSKQKFHKSKGESS